VQAHCSASWRSLHHYDLGPISHRNPQEGVWEPVVHVNQLKRNLIDPKVIQDSNDLLTRPWSGFRRELAVLDILNGEGPLDQLANYPVYSCGGVTHVAELVIGVILDVKKGVT
jgi:hypothetical protein